MRKQAIIGVLGMAFFLFGCGREDRDGGKPTRSGIGDDTLPVVYTVNYPLAYLAQRIGGGAIQVEFPAPGDEDPAFWKPDAEAIARYQKADLILLNGAGYAQWVPRAPLPDSRRVDTSASFREAYIALEEAVTHSHGPGGEHEHGSTAFTTWLDLSLCGQQAEAIRDSLSKRWPEKEKEFQANCQVIIGELAALDKVLLGIGQTHKDVPLVVSHPVYQYFARRYGLNVRSVHWEPDEYPAEELWKEFSDLLKEHPSKLMVWEGEPGEKVVAELGKMGVHSVVFDPCGNRPDTGDLMSVMRKNVDDLSTALKKGGQQP